MPQMIYNFTNAKKDEIANEFRAYWESKNAPDVEFEIINVERINSNNYESFQNGMWVVYDDDYRRVYNAGKLNIAIMLYNQYDCMIMAI